MSSKRKTKDEGSKSGKVRKLEESTSTETGRTAAELKDYADKVRLTHQCSRRTSIRSEI